MILLPGTATGTIPSGCWIVRKPHILHFHSSSNKGLPFVLAANSSRVPGHPTSAGVVMMILFQDCLKWILEITNNGYAWMKPVEVCFANRNKSSQPLLRKPWVKSTYASQTGNQVQLCFANRKSSQPLNMTLNEQKWTTDQCFRSRSNSKTIDRKSLEHWLRMQFDELVNSGNW